MAYPLLAGVKHLGVEHQNDRSTVDFFLQKVDIFVLILARILSFIAVAPFFNYRAMPVQLKAAGAVVIAILLYPNVPAPTVTTSVSIGYAVLVAQEVLVGLIMGFSAEVIFYAIRFAGDLLGHQIGFAIVSIFDPQTNQDSSVIAELQWLTAMLIFLTIDGHFLLLDGLARSFTAVPLASATFHDGLVEFLVRLSARVFVIAVQISAPVMVTLLMTNIAMGILARTLPQMNVFAVGFPLTIGVGLLSLAIVMPIFATFMQRFLTLLRENTVVIMRLLGG